MAQLGKTIESLTKYRKHWESRMAAVAAQSSEARSKPAAARLREVGPFGSNPGNLRMLAHVPAGLPAASPLVVVLHGCTQTAAGYDHGAGWSTVADRYGFALLMPEQQQANNANGCFNWFQPGDTTRGQGEALSIRQMIERMARDHGTDPKRVFITGLSAGGAMTSVMLATYPEMFAGGAVIAGLPHGSAASVQEAFECMFQGKTRSPREWGDLVRAASPHRGPWPKLSVWHGGADATVKPMNAGEIVKQWTDVHGLSPRPDQTDKVNGYPREVWHDAAGREVIESLTIPSMAHGTPLATGNGEENFGAAGPFLLEVGISSTYHIAKFWGLTDRVLHMANSDLAHVSPGGLVEVRTMSEAPESTDTGAGPDRTPSMPDWQRSLPPEISSIIDKAFKAAGLKS